MARQHAIGQFVPFCQAGLPALTVEDIHQRTIHPEQLHDKQCLICFSNFMDLIASEADITTTRNSLDIIS